MSVSADKIRSGLTGALSKGPYGAAAPTDASSAIDAAYTDTGAISTDGVTLTLPDSGEKVTLKIWQDDAQVRVFRRVSEDLPTVTFTMLETNKTAVELYFGVTVDTDHGSFEYTVDLPDPFAYVLDVIDGTAHHRLHFPRGVKASVGDLVYQNGEPIGYQVTIEAEYDPAKTYAFKGWMTDLIEESSSSSS